MNTTDLLVEVLILGFQVFAWLSLIVAIVLGFDWIPFTSFKDWVAIIALFVIGASYTLGIIFDNFFFSLFENRKIAIKTIRNIVVDEVTRKALKNWQKTPEYYYIQPKSFIQYLNWLLRGRERHILRYRRMIQKALDADKPDSLIKSETFHEFPVHWQAALEKEIDALLTAPPNEFPEVVALDWEYISSRDPRQARLYILAEDEKLGKELEKYLNKAGLARGSSLNLVIIGALSLTLYLIKVGFSWNVFLFGIVSTITFAMLAYNTWRQSALVYYFTLWDLLKLTQQRRIKEYYEHRRK